MHAVTACNNYALGFLWFNRPNRGPYDSYYFSYTFELLVNGIFILNENRRHPPQIQLYLRKVYSSALKLFVRLLRFGT